MKRLLTAAIALSLLTGTAAMAQPDHRDDHAAAGAQQQSHWARGQRMPKTYYSDRSHYVDYRSNHLSAPRRGYRWVRTDDNNYAMVAITTGLIASIVAANH
jgi:Ni/Co efflux regulator RcnB